MKLTQADGILSYRHFFYLKLSLFLNLISVGVYLWHSPVIMPNGGTWLGYSLGGLATFLLLWLLWLGVRKRHYASNWGMVRGWASAHVYLGLSLVLLVSLHSGFQFGWNIHTLAYVLMIIVVASGMYGVFAYHTYPKKISQGRGGLDTATVLQEITELNQESTHLAVSLDNVIHTTVLKAIEKTRIGGSLWQQLHVTKLGKGSQFWWQKTNQDLAEIIDENYDKTMYRLANHLITKQDEDSRRPLRRLLELLGRRNALIKRLQQHIQQKALMKVWLFVHIPFSFAFLSATLIHIVSVFLYW